MARRRKLAFLEDDSDLSATSQEDDLDEQGFEDDDPDARAERSLFENPYQHKRRRVGGKDDATYGVFGDDDEEKGFSQSGNSKKEKRLHFTHAPAFVTGEERTHQNMLSGEAAEDIEVEGYAEGNKHGLTDSDDDPTQANPVHEVNEAPEGDIQQMGMGGLGSAGHQFASARTPSRDGIGHGPGIGPGGGIGSSRWRASAAAEQSLPGAFGSTSRLPQRSFLRDSTGSAASSVPGTPKLSREEKMHFDKLQGSFGAKLMAKMGWQAGTGLGAAAEGIVTPVETKLRPKPSMGLAYRGFKEKTAQSKAEARRRGDFVSDSDEDGETALRRTRLKDKGQQSRSDAWKKPKRTRVKVDHQTYEQIVQNIGLEVQAGIGKIYDATGREMREVSSLADVALPSASWTPSTDMMRIPEVRHNVRLIVDLAKGDLDGLAREAKALEERKKWVQTEDERLRRKVGDEAELIARLQSVHLIVDEVRSHSQPSGGDYEPSLEVFSPHIEKLVTEFAKEYEIYRLDEIVIGAISPVIQELLSSWKPLRHPTMLVDIFRRWRHALKFSAVENRLEGTDIDIHGAQSMNTIPPSQNSSMTPYESLMWNAWLPKVRSCLNNEWSPLDAAPAIQLYETWTNLIPPFIRDNILDQLVIPKVQKAVAEWQPHAGGPMLQALVFPWLPHVGLRMEELLEEARRKVKSLLRNWVFSDRVPEDLLSWKEVFAASDWDAMILKYILPKLGAALREDFAVNPRNQDLTVLQRVLEWCPLLRGSVFSQLLEVEFFPKWLDVLHVWLIQPKASFEEIAQWYAFWKDVFPQDVLDLPATTNGFTRGLQLMNKAIELGPDAGKLPRPDHRAPATPLVANGSRQGTPKSRPTPARATEVTFRSIVEDFAASHDLLFIPTGRAHEKSRMPLFRVSHSVNNKGGVLVFILDDAVWALEGDSYRVITLEEMVLRANKPR